jgi:hypothetical protein
VADIAQVLATGGTALVGAAAGAGLTYWLGALNRRHQEARENETRWYEARLQAYIELHQACYDAYFSAWGKRPTKEVTDRLAARLMNARGAIHFVGSPEVIKAAERVINGTLEELGDDRDMSGDFLDQLERFQVVARDDLGHLEAPSPQTKNERKDPPTTEKAEGEAEAGQPR